MLRGWIAVITIGSALAACSSDGIRESNRPIHRVSPAAAGQGSRPTHGEVYIVTRGDTLYSIAFRNQLDYHDLAEWNGIGRDYTIKVGQELRLTPPDGSPLPPPVASSRAPGRDVAGSSGGTSSSNASASSAPASRGTGTSPSAPTSASAAAASGTAMARGGAAAGASASTSSGGSGAAGSSAPPSAAVTPGSGSGLWQWPTRGPLLRGFGTEGSKGLDIGGEVGQTIVASRAGKVVYSGSALKGYGELVIIKHDEETLSAYGYNRRRLVEEGDSVTAGQPIAELGIGPEQRPLLHFEIRDHGRPVDPKPLLP